VHLTNKFFSTSIVVLLLTALSSCATIAPPAPKTSAMSWSTRKAQLAQILNWQINGKIAVTTSQDSGSANIDWSQRAQNYTISLYGPLGANNVTLNGSANKVTMQTSNGQTVSAGSAEQLLAQQWGWKLPVSYLKYWIRGLPVPNMPQQSRYDDAQRIATLNQGGFTVQYSDYTSKGSVDLPSRMTIQSAALKSKIVIYKWNISD